MDLRQLRYFVAVAKSGSFTAATEILGLSQPALGLQVRQLEFYLGANLLARHSRGVTLTEAGTIFLEHANAILARVERAEAALQAFRPGHQAETSSSAREIRFGVVPSTTRSIMPDLIDACAQAKSPSLRLSVRQGYDRELMTAARAKELDVVFRYDAPRSKQLGVMPLYYDDLVLVGPIQIVRPAEGDIPFRDLPQFPLIMSGTQRGARALVEKAAAKHGVDVRIQYEVDAYELKRKLLTEKQCCTIVSSAMYLDDLKAEAFGARRIVSPSLRRKLCLVYSRELPACVIEFLQSSIRRIVECRFGENMRGWRRLSTDLGPASDCQASTTGGRRAVRRLLEPVS